MVVWYCLRYRLWLNDIVKGTGLGYGLMILLMEQGMVNNIVNGTEYGWMILLKGIGYGWNI